MAVADYIVYTRDIVIGSDTDPDAQPTPGMTTRAWRMRMRGTSLGR